VARQRLLRQRVLAEQPLPEARVREVREHRAVVDLDQLQGIVLTKPPGLHLALEKHDRAIHERARVLGQHLLEPAAAVKGLAPHDAHEVAVRREEAEARVEDRLHLREPGQPGRRRGLGVVGPVRHGGGDHRRIEVFLGLEVVQQRRVAEPRARCDAGQPRAAESVLCELLTGDLQDALLGAELDGAHGAHDTGLLTGQ